MFTVVAEPIKTWKAGRWEASFAGLAGTYLRNGGTGAGLGLMGGYNLVHKWNLFGSVGASEIDWAGKEQRFGLFAGLSVKFGG